jgi:hypothetical protein
MIVVQMACKPKTYYTYKNTVGIPPAEFAMMDTPNYTIIEMRNTTFDFGTITQGDSAVLEYQFKNTGDNTLFFSGVYPSCGCTVPTYSTEPILPGKSSSLKAIYHSREDTGQVHKTIKILTNTSNRIERILEFHGYVKPK